MQHQNFLLLNHQRPASLTRLVVLNSQPHPPKQHDNRRKEPQPHPPPHARLLRHPQHAIHGAPDLIPAALELVVHSLRKACGVADFVADEVG